jgi:hypothetical protein
MRIFGSYLQPKSNTKLKINSKILMKEYHTSVEINCTPEELWKELTNFSEYENWNPIVGKLEGKMTVGNKISTYIVPLKQTYYPKLLSYEINSELIWKGVQGANFLMAGEHYYKIKKIADNKVKLLHGEYFTGLFSYFISPSLLNKMKTAFEQHNNIIKQRIENGKK